ncbi:hypothetical protein NCC49_004580, partial [Naganishia albida]
SVQLVKEIMSRSPGKRDRSEELQRLNERRSEERIDLDDEEPDALERARCRIAAWPIRGIRSNATNSASRLTTDDSHLSMQDQHLGASKTDGYTHTEGETRDGFEISLDAGASSRLAERVARIEALGVITDDQDTRRRRIDDLNHQSSRDNMASTQHTAARGDQTSFVPIRSRSTSHQTSPPHQDEPPLVISHLPTSRHTTPQNDPAQTHSLPFLHQHPNHDPDLQQRNLSSSASPSSFQRRFREIQRQSPGRISWRRGAQEETGRSSGVKDGDGAAEGDAARAERQREEEGSLMDGTVGIQRQRNMSEQDRTATDETGDGSGRHLSWTSARDMPNATAISQDRSRTATRGVSTVQDRLSPTGLRGDGMEDGSGAVRRRQSADGGDPVGETTSTSRTNDTTDARRVNGSRICEQHHGRTPISNAREALPAPPPSARDMSFAQIDHSTPVRQSSLNKMGNRLFASSEDDDTVDSTVSSSPVVIVPAMADEGPSRSILRHDGGSRVGVSFREGGRSREGVSVRSGAQSGEVVSRDDRAEEPSHLATRDTSVRETTRASQGVSFHTPQRSPNPARASSHDLETSILQRNSDLTQRSSRSATSVKTRSETVRESSEEVLEPARSAREDVEEEHKEVMSHSDWRKPAERHEQGESSSRPYTSGTEPSPAPRVVHTPPATTTPLPTTSPSPRRRSTRRSGSPSRSFGHETRQTSYEQRTEKSLFGVTLEATSCGEASSSQIAGVKQEDMGRTVPPFDVGTHTPPLDFRIKQADEGRPDMPTDTQVANAPLESAVGRHVLAWFETHKLLERDLTIAERDAAAAEEELRDALKRDTVPARQSGRERERDNVRWMRWAAAGVILLLLMARLSPARAPLSASDEFFYAPLQSAHLSSLRFSRHPLAIRLFFHLLRLVFGERQVIRWISWTGEGVPSAVIGRGLGLHVPV